MKLEFQWMNYDEKLPPYCRPAMPFQTRLEILELRTK